MGSATTGNSKGKGEATKGDFIMTGKGGDFIKGAKGDAKGKGDATKGDFNKGAKSDATKGKGDDLPGDPWAPIIKRAMGDATKGDGDDWDERITGPGGLRFSVRKSRSASPDPPPPTEPPPSSEDEGLLWV